MIETLLLFNSFLNVYLHRLSEITKVVKIIQPLINEFVSIIKSITLGPSIRNFSQNKAVKEKVLLLRDRILAQTELLFNLKMNERFDNITAYFCSKRPVLDLIELLSHFDEKPTYFSTFINRRLNSFCLALSNQFEECLDSLKDDVAVIGGTVKNQAQQDVFIEVQGV